MTGKRYLSTLQQGMTLIELSVVLLILVALAGLATPYVSGVGSTAMCQTTDATMHAVKEAIMGGGAGAGFYGDTLGQLPRDRYVGTGYSLNYLFIRDDGLDNDEDGNLPSSDGITNVDPDDEWRAYNSKTGVGWRGPYLQTSVRLDPNTLIKARYHPNSDQCVDGDPYLDESFIDKTKGYVHDNLVDSCPSRTGSSVILDGWGRPIIFQLYEDISTTPHTFIPRLVSAGPGAGVGFQEGKIETKISDPDRPKDADGHYTSDDRILNLKGSTPANTPCDLL